MLCDRCKKNIASNVYTQNINGKVYKYYLCDDCAKQLTNVNFFLDDLISSLISSGSNLSNISKSSEYCPKCGTTFENIAKTGKVGCAYCYEVFRDALLPSIKKLHANTKHIGNIPSSFASSNSFKLSSLKSQLDIAIKNQEFEEAAKLRDQINDLKKAGDNTDE